MLTLAKGGCPIHPPCTYTQALYLDGQQVGTASASASATGSWSNFALGAGYIGGSWPNYPNNNAAGGAVGISYLGGDLSNVSLNYTGAVSGNI